MNQRLTRDIIGETSNTKLVVDGATQTRPTGATALSIMPRPEGQRFFSSIIEIDNVHEC